MPAGLSAGGSVALVFETAMGTYLDPSTAGAIWVPILEESLEYNEAKYYSEAIRQQTMDSAEAPGYYHVGGDITVEVDCAFLPYWLYSTRSIITKTGASSPFTYTFVPSSAGQAVTAASGAAQRTLSITIQRNGVGFGYAGCTVTGVSFTVTDGVLRATFNVMGVSEATPVALGTPAWVDPILLGADAHNIYVTAGGSTPTYGAVSLDFNGYTYTRQDNGDAQNRIRADRQASFIKYGKTEVTVETELDFQNKTEYDKMKSSAKSAIRYEGIAGGGAGATYASATVNALQVDLSNAVYDAYNPHLGALADLVTAATTFHGLAIPGGASTKISVKSTASIT